MVSARALSPGSGFAGPRTGSAVPDAADRRLDARRGKPLGILDRDVLHTAIAVVNEAAAPDRPALVQSLLQRIQHKAGVSRAGDTPADDTPREDVDDKGDIELPRVSRRLQLLRGWSHDEASSPVFPRGPCPRGSDGPGPPRRARLAVGSDPLDCREDRLLGRDAASLGAAGRA